MVLGHAGYALFMDWRTTRSEAEKHVSSVGARLMTKEFPQIADSDLKFADALTRDPALLEAFNSKDHEAVGKALKAYVDRTGLDAIITVVDGKGKVIYSTEMPAKSGFMIGDKCSGFELVLTRSAPWRGPTAFSPTGDILITSMAPIKTGSNPVGVVAVSQPISSEFLTGLVSKFKFMDDEPLLKGVDLALFGPREGKITAYSNGLVGRDGGFLDKVNQLGVKAISDKQFVNGDRLWQSFAMAEGNSTVGNLLVTTSLPSIMPKVIYYAGQAGAAAAIALILAFIFSTAISGGIRRRLHFLIGRAHDLAQQKSSLPALEGLEGEWLELGELMDTAVTSMRSTIQGLKSQLSKRSVETEEKTKQEDFSSEQLVHLNRQLSEKTRQLSELSKQINFGSQQTVLLQQKLDAVLQISTEGFLMLDQYGNVLSANPVFLNWLGVKEGEIAGRLCFDLVCKPGEPRGNVQSQAFSRHSGNPADLINQFYPEAVVYHHYQEKSVEVLAHLHPVVTDDQNIQGWIMVLRDKSLRSEVAQLRTEIVAMLSDSIRAPLVSVEGSWKTLLSNANQTMHPSVGQALAQLHTHYEQLIGLVDSLLMMYGGIVPPPVIPRELVVVTRLVAECLEEVAANAREHRLSLDYKTVTGLPNLNSDREALKRVMLQLLEKMIVISPPGGRVRVESLVKGQEMRIGVTSSGAVVNQEEIDEMFVGFIEGKHDQASYSSRLSMYLARNNIERLGGKIWAESDASRGTSIFFILTIS